MSHIPGRQSIKINDDVVTSIEEYLPNIFYATLYSFVALTIWCVCFFLTQMGAANS